MTWLDDGVPGQLQPGKRPLTTLSPGLALRDGKPYMVYGTPGGDQQDQWTVQFFLRHAAGLNLQEAIEAPSWHVDHFPGSFWPRAFAQPRHGGIACPRPLKPAPGRPRGGDRSGLVGGPHQRLHPRNGAGRRLLLRAGANPRGMQGYAVGR